MTTKLSVAGKTLTALMLSAGVSFAPVIAPALMLVAPAAQAAAPVVTGLPDFTELVDKVGPAVVNIRTTEHLKAGVGGGQAMPDEDEMREFLRRFFRSEERRVGKECRSRW